MPILRHSIKSRLYNGYAILEPLSLLRATQLTLELTPAVSEW